MLYVVDCRLEFLVGGRRQVKWTEIECGKKQNTCVCVCELSPGSFTLFNFFSFRFFLLCVFGPGRRTLGGPTPLRRASFTTTTTATTTTQHLTRLDMHALFCYGGNG